MTPIERKGLVAPTVVAAASSAAWAIGGPVASLSVLAIGAAAIIAFHLWHLQQISDWANSALDSEVPEGRGEWATAFAAIHRRARLQGKYERDLRQIVERFQQAAAALPDGVVALNAAGRIEWANPRAVEQLGLDLAHDRGQPIVNLVRYPDFLRYVDAGDFAVSIVAFVVIVTVVLLAEWALIVTGEDDDSMTTAT